jgi:hypothetical protein
VLRLLPRNEGRQAEEEERGAYSQQHHDLRVRCLFLRVQLCAAQRAIFIFAGREQLLGFPIKRTLKFTLRVVCISAASSFS